MRMHGQIVAAMHELRLPGCFPPTNVIWDQILHGQRRQGGVSALPRTSIKILLTLWYGEVDFEGSNNFFPDRGGEITVVQ